MHPLRFDELDSEPRTLEMSGSVAAAFAQTKLVGVVPTGQSTWALTPTGLVGAARVGPHEVIVLPKEAVPITRLLFLLGYARRPGFIADHWAPAEAAPDLLPILAETLARQLDRALLLGPIQGYVSTTDTLNTVRGRIDMDEQIRRRQGLAFPIEVAFDDYTLDTPENRLLLTAATRATEFPRISASVRSRLRHAEGKLEGVQRVSRGQTLPRWRMTRLNTRYHDALVLAETLLRHTSLETAAGGEADVAAFAVDMAKVFEDFVSTALTEAGRERGAVLVEQYPTYLDRSRTVAMRPDIVQLDGSRPIAILDAKYKRSVESGARNPDAYQMLAYCTALGVKEGWLVHASSAAKAGESPAILVTGADVTIRQWGLDLSASPDEILSQVAALADVALAGQLTD
jgi:5-methylcytosine-specific restriction enzyme subunit McrC